MMVVVGDKKMKGAAVVGCGKTRVEVRSCRVVCLISSVASIGG